MNEEQLNQILTSLRTNSRSILELTPVTSLGDNDYFEISGGKRIAYSDLSGLITAIIEGDNDEIAARINEISNRIGTVEHSVADVPSQITIAQNNVLRQIRQELEQNYATKVKAAELETAIDAAIDQAVDRAGELDDALRAEIERDYANKQDLAITNEGVAANTSAIDEIRTDIRDNVKTDITKIKERLLQFRLDGFIRTGFNRDELEEGFYWHTDENYLYRKHGAAGGLVVIPSKSLLYDDERIYLYLKTNDSEQQLIPLANLNEVATQVDIATLQTAIEGACENAVDRAADLDNALRAEIERDYANKQDLALVNDVVRVNINTIASHTNIIRNEIKPDIAEVNRRLLGNRLAGTVEHFNPDVLPEGIYWYTSVSKLFYKSVSGFGELTTLPSRSLLYDDERVYLFLKSDDEHQLIPLANLDEVALVSRNIKGLRSTYEQWSKGEWKFDADKPVGTGPRPQTPNPNPTRRAEFRCEKGSVFEFENLHDWAFLDADRMIIMRKPSGSQYSASVTAPEGACSWVIQSSNPLAWVECGSVSAAIYAEAKKRDKAIKKAVKAERGRLNFRAKHICSGRFSLNAVPGNVYVNRKVIGSDNYPGVVFVGHGERVGEDEFRFDLSKISKAVADFSLDRLIVCGDSDRNIEISNTNPSDDGRSVVIKICTKYKEALHANLYYLTNITTQFIKINKKGRIVGVPPEEVSLERLKLPKIAPSNFIVTNKYHDKYGVEHEYTTPFVSRRYKDNDPCIEMQVRRHVRTWPKLASERVRNQNTRSCYRYKWVPTDYFMEFARHTKPDKQKYCLVDFRVRYRSRNGNVGDWLYCQAWREKGESRIFWKVSDTNSNFIYKNTIPSGAVAPSLPSNFRRLNEYYRPQIPKDSAQS